MIRLPRSSEPFSAPSNVWVRGVDAQSAAGQALLRDYAGPIRQYFLSQQQNSLLAMGDFRGVHTQRDEMRLTYTRINGQTRMIIEFSPRIVQEYERREEEAGRRQRIPEEFLDGYISVSSNSGSVTGSLVVALNGQTLGTVSFPNVVDSHVWQFGQDFTRQRTYPIRETYPAFLGDPTPNYNNPNVDQLLPEVSPLRDDGYRPYLYPFWPSNIIGGGPPTVTVYDLDLFDSRLNLRGQNTLTITAGGGGVAAVYFAAVEFYSRNSTTVRNVAIHPKDPAPVFDPKLPPHEIMDHPMFMVLAAIVAPGTTTTLLFNLSEDATVFPPSYYYENENDPSNTIYANREYRWVELPGHPDDGERPVYY
jgi:hypothetical protein